MLRLESTVVMAQPSASGTSSRRLIRDQDVNSSGSTRYTESEWETKEVGFI